MIWNMLLLMLNQWRILCLALKSGRFLGLMQALEHNLKRCGRPGYVSADLSPSKIKGDRTKYHEMASV
jgi:hypothetical protein